MAWRGVVAVVLLALGSAVACGGESEEGSTPGTGGQPSGGAAGAGGVAGASGGTGGGAGAPSVGRCGDPVPAGAPTAKPPPAYSGGACPKLAAGVGTIQSTAERKFILVLPKDMKADEKLPLIFLWHWLGGEAKDFLEKGEIQAAVDTQRFIAVIPEKKGDALFVWPVEIIQSQARVDEELRFFDDLLSCVSEQFPVDANCVSTAGVSAGALFTDLLAGHRSEHLASFLSLSGGVGGVIRAWGNPAHKLPGMVLWGGPTDTCAGLFSFNSLSATLESALEKDGHFFLECVHNCGHAEPPMAGAAGFSKYQALWQFAKDHPYWLPAGASPYLTEGLPSAMPEWCGIGKGSAKPREGVCLDPSQC
jgi:poly(3-hydroxybutyrate) depolymerase